MTFRARRPLRILLSVYACSPRQGSEEGVGWRWARELAERGHQVTILTRTAYRDEIETERAQIDALGMRCVYIDSAPGVNYTSTPRWIGYPYIYLWQILALRVASRLHAETPFDLAHHLTFGGVRFPSFLWRLGIPFIFGPVGGGETSPRRLRAGLPRNGRRQEWLRDLSNAFVRWDPIMRLTFRRADQVVVRTRDNLPLLPRRVRRRAQVARECGIDTAEFLRAQTPPPSGPDAPLRVLFVGRLLGWKGVHLALAAVAKARLSRPITFTCVGSGKDRDFLHETALRLGLADVTWIDHVAKTEMPAIYAAHDLLLFPSLHDSGANVVNEAATLGLPVVCLDLGAPGDVVAPDFGIVVATRDRDEAAVTDGLAAALLQLDAERPALRAMGEAGIAWAQEQSWAAYVDRVYAPIEGRLAVADGPVGARAPATGALGTP